MSTAAFLAQMGIHRLGKLGDAMTKAVVAFDPETAGEVEIENMKQHSRDLAARVAEAESVEEKDHAKVTAITTQLNRTMQAANILGQQLKTAQEAGNTVLAATLTNQLNPLLAQIEQIGGEEGDGSKSGTLFDANQDHAASEADLHEWQQVHAGVIAQLTTADARLKRARSDMEHAHQQEERARERQMQAERDAGLKHGLDANNVALSAMQAAADEAKRRARAATINTDALRSTTSNSADDIVAATLAAQAPTPVSALDRLAKLSGKSAA